MEIHLDLVGGLAGDMFVAAMVDALPQHESVVARAIDAVVAFSPVSAGFAPHRDGVLTGRRFSVTRMLRPRAPDGGLRDWTRQAGQHDTSQHAHVSWRSIRAALEGSALDAAAQRHAIGIFSLLAAAEAAVHGLEVDAVEFHEVGAWDSIADIVAAAAVIAAVGASRWTASPAPLGSGRINTAHGMLPVPAPATARLLLGMQTIDDGVPGERVTPTGAAILRYLCGAEQLAAQRSNPPRTLVATGSGFGTRQLPGVSNCVRVLCFEPVAQATAEHRRLHIVEFDVDDQSGEDLAAGLDRLRQYPAVLDVTQSPLVGKKNRMASLIRVLVRANQLEAAIDGCFRETTTIGLRHHPAEGIALKRVTQSVEVDGERLRVKVVDRPGGRTAKAESDDVLAHRDHAARVVLRRRAEALALRDSSVTADA